jgi:hypothetical protein
MRNVMLLSLCLLFVGCASDEARWKYWQAVCSKEGWTIGTPEHDGCVTVQRANYVKGFGPAVGVMMPMGPAAPRQCYTSGSGHTSCY